jgi:restriction endonuclease S subunit
MGLKVTSYNLSTFSGDPFLRMDFDYLEITKELNISREVPRLKKFITLLETGHPITKEDYYLDGKSDYIHIVVRNIKGGELHLSNPIYINDDKGEELNKHKLVKGEIVIAISASCGASFIYNGSNDDVQLTLSHYLAKLKVNESKINPTLLVYYLNSGIMQKYFRSTETGKTQKNLSKYYIRELPMLIPEDVKEQLRIANKIAPLDIEIKQLKTQIKPDAEIINEIFTKRFGWDTAKFIELKSIHLIIGTFSAFSNNIDNRFSFKFHNKAGEYVSNILKSQTSKRIKDFLAEDITLGKSISPTDYYENGEQFYVSMADIKNWCFETEEAKTVLQSYFDANQNKRIALNDIIMARSGEGTIGKVAIIDNEENEAVYADFTMRIRFKDYNPTFAYYYFRTDFFQYLIYTNKKGLGNNTNIFPSQVRELPVPDISLNEQNRIVNEIKSETDKQRVFDKKIAEKKRQIDLLVQNAIYKFYKPS